MPNIETQQAGQGNFARLEVNVPADRVKLLDYKEGEHSTISVVEDKQSRARTIYLDGFSTATVSSAFSGSTYMQAMGFVPMALHPAPNRSALAPCSREARPGNLPPVEWNTAFQTALLWDGRDGTSTTL